jgi:hypothetical protein
MVKTKRLRVKIIKMMKEHGSLNTGEIFDMVNEYNGKYSIKNGSTMNQVGNILSKEPVFEKLIDAEDPNAPIVRGGNGQSYPLSVWGINKDVLDAFPELEKSTTNSYGLNYSIVLSP